jgi:hypothetical protein
MLSTHACIAVCVRCTRPSSFSGCVPHHSSVVPAGVVAQAFDEYRALELRQTELEELLEHGEGDVAALQQELDDVNDKMEKLEAEMMSGEDNESD